MVLLTKKICRVNSKTNHDMRKCRLCSIFSASHERISFFDQCTKIDFSSSCQTLQATSRNNCWLAWQMWRETNFRPSFHLLPEIGMKLLLTTSSSLSPLNFREGAALFTSSLLQNLPVYEVVVDSCGVQSLPTGDFYSNYFKLLVTKFKIMFSHSPLINASPSSNNNFQIAAHYIQRRIWE